MANDYRQMDLNNNTLLTKETAMLNQELSDKVHQAYVSAVLTALNKHFEFPVYNKKLYLETVPKYYNKYENSSLNFVIYQTMTHNKFYGKIKYKVCSKPGYRKLYVTFYEPNYYSRKIIKKIAKKQRPGQTAFQYNIMPFFGYSVRGAYADYHNYSLALTPYGYAVNLMFSAYDGHYLTISLS